MICPVQGKVGGPKRGQCREVKKTNERRVFILGPGDPAVEEIEKEY